MIASWVATRSSSVVCAVMLSVLAGCGARTEMPGDRKDEPETPASTACEDFCEGYTGWCDYTGSCVDDCRAQTEHLGACEPELEALIECMRARLYVEGTDCVQYEPLKACEDESAALDQCIHGGACISDCDQIIAPADRVRLTCKHTCGDRVFESNCVPNGSTVFPFSCDCGVDGTTVATCQNVTNDLGFGFSCCGAFFAEEL